MDTAYMRYGWMEHTRGSSTSPNEGGEGGEGATTVMYLCVVAPVMAKIPHDSCDRPTEPERAEAGVHLGCGCGCEEGMVMGLCGMMLRQNRAMQLWWNGNRAMQRSVSDGVGWVLDGC